MDTILAKSIQLAYSLIRFADDSTTFRTQCLQLKSNAQKLLALLHRAARTNNEPYERPLHHIIYDMEQVLDKALALVLKCRGNILMTRVFIIIPTAAFSRTLSQLKNCIANVTWLLSISAPDDDLADEYLARDNSPICRRITESRALLCFAVLLEKGGAEVQYNSAMALMEITVVAELDVELRRSAFKPNSQACKAMFDQCWIQCIEQ